MDGPHPISLRLQEKKCGHQLRKKILPCRLPLDLNCSIPLWVSGLLACPSDYGLAILHNNMSQFLKINLSPPLSIHVYTLLILFLWRTLTRFPSFLLFFLPSVYHVSIAVIQTKSLGRYCLSYMCLDLENFEGSASSTQWIWGTEGVHGGHQGVILRILLQEGPSALSRLYWGTGLSWNVMPFSDWLSCRHPSHPRSHTLGSSCIQWHPNWGGKEVILAPELPAKLADPPWVSANLLPGLSTAPVSFKQVLIPGLFIKHPVP